MLIGSTEKMGVGTNVQDRAIALHHLDCPWRPADVAQREGRILRQGNLNPEVAIIRYVTERSFDGYMWQTVERKARFIAQVMRGRLDIREIDDIGDTALSFSEVKALATGNPLLMDKAEADAELARLERAERAHRRNQDALRRALDHFEAEIARLTQLATTIDSAIKRRRDTHGDQFTMAVGGRRYDKRADAGQHLKQLAERELAALTGSLERSVSAGELGGFPVTVALDRSLGQTHVTFSLDGAPGASIELAAHDIRGADPIGLVTRLENRLSRLDERKATALADTDHARREVTHARDGIGQPFPHAAELGAAHDRARQIDEALERMARPDTENLTPDPAEASGGREENTPGAADSGPEAAEAQAQAAAREVAYPAGPAADTAPAARPPAGLDHRQAGTPPRRAATRDPDRGQASSASAVPHHTNDTVPSHPDVAAARQRPGRSQAVDSPPTADSQHVLASRAALAANEAYRAGDLDQARQLIDQAEALDPSRADLWQQHRAEITARQLFLAARTAHAEGDHHRAEKLIGDARQLDPRMRALWNQDLPATQAGPHRPGPVNGSPARGTARRGAQITQSATPSRVAGRARCPESPRSLLRMVILLPRLAHRPYRAQASTRPGPVPAGLAQEAARRLGGGSHGRSATTQRRPRPGSAGRSHQARPCSGRRQPTGGTP